VLGRSALDTPEGRARAARAALEVIAEHPDVLVRDQYLMELADKCRIDVDRLRDGSLAASGAPASNRDGRDGRPRPEPAGPRSARPDSPELQALRVAVHDPEPVAALLDEMLFDDPIALGAFRALAAAPTFHDAIENADPGAAELLQQLAVEEPEGEPEEAAARLIEEGVRREVGRLEAEARQNNTQEHFARVSPDVSMAKLQLERLREPSSRLDAAGQLLGWLHEMTEERND
jgi:hypothetical protein